MSGRLFEVAVEFVTYMLIGLALGLGWLAAHEVWRWAT